MVFWAWIPWPAPTAREEAAQRDAQSRRAHGHRLGPDERNESNTVFRVVLKLYKFQSQGFLNLRYEDEEYMLFFCERSEWSTSASTTNGCVVEYGDSAWSTSSKTANGIKWLCI